eukprot:scaffold737_cov127-Skeletonema_marinoi.AAC.7
MAIGCWVAKGSPTYKMNTLISLNTRVCDGIGRSLWLLVLGGERVPNLQCEYTYMLITYGGSE